MTVHSGRSTRVVCSGEFVSQTGVGMRKDVVEAVCSIHTVVGIRGKGVLSMHWSGRGVPLSRLQWNQADC
jgi:hypothetical protein